MGGLGGSDLHLAVTAAEVGLLTATWNTVVLLARSSRVTWMKSSLEPLPSATTGWPNSTCVFAARPV